ncbi:hypothetical protein T10_9154 [Trichinella papuae]|uniref:Uncharacterized protein n=1 Tax=Trichinella papuae TaxID=268474 RepID=A0A0V1MT75_9BILA|nr:hypothetical protein T10_9154 [Trichinella papuae]
MQGDNWTLTITVRLCGFTLLTKRTTKCEITFSLVSFSFEIIVSNSVRRLNDENMPLFFSEPLSFTKIEEWRRGLHEAELQTKCVSDYPWFLNL